MAKLSKSPVTKEAAHLPLMQRPIANSAFGAIGGAIGAAAVSASLPVILPFLVAGGVAGYFLTNQTPAE